MGRSGYPGSALCVYSFRLGGGGVGAQSAAGHTNGGLTSDAGRQPLTRAAQFALSSTKA